jgi:hypothetical protein
MNQNTAADDARSGSSDRRRCRKNRLDPAQLAEKISKAIQHGVSRLSTGGQDCLQTHRGQALHASMNEAWQPKKTSASGLKNRKLGHFIYHLMIVLEKQLGVRAYLVSAAIIGQFANLNGTRTRRLNNVISVLCNRSLLHGSLVAGSPS